MMNIATALLHLFPNADPARDFIVADHGQGPVLQGWRLTATQPTEQELETAWTAVQAKQAGAIQVQAARDAMAALYGSLADQVRADHGGDYDAVGKLMDRGDFAAARLRVETMTVSTAVPEEEREPLRQQFLAIFPNG